MIQKHPIVVSKYMKYIEIVQNMYEIKTVLVTFGIDLYLPYFKFSPSIRGVFALSDELVRDEDPNSLYTSNIEVMQSRGIFLNFTFQ